MIVDAFIHTPLDDYELIDFGRGRRLERFGPYVVERPDTKASGPRAQTEWHPDWVYRGPAAGGTWVPQREGLPDRWLVNVDGYALQCRPEPRGRMSVAPEYVQCWRWVRSRLEGCYHIRDLEALHLFAGSGGTLPALQAGGAGVTCVDMDAQGLELARLNAGEAGARILHEDVAAFVERTVRARQAYHMVVLDPPGFQRGMRGGAWDNKCDLQPLVKQLPRLVSNECLGIWISLPDRDMSADSLAQLLNDVLPGRTVEALQLGLATAEGRALPMGVAALWYDESGLMAEDGSLPSLNAGQIEARLDVYLDAALSSRRTAAEPARRLAAFDRAPQEFVLSWTEIAARTNAEMAYQIAAHAPEALTTMDEQTAEAWIVQAMDTFDTGGLHSGVASLREVEQFAREARAKARGLSFDEVAGILETFVQGLSGRRLKLEPAETACTDTDTLFLPAMVARLPSQAENFRLYKAMAVHQWAQCRYGTYRENLPAVLARYGDEQRALELFHALETLRLDACVARDLPGMHREMHGLCTALDERPVPPGWEAYAERLVDPAASVWDSLALLEDVYGRRPPPRLCFQGPMIPERAEGAKAARLEREKNQFRLMLARLGDDARKGNLQQEETAPALESGRFDVHHHADPEARAGMSCELLLDGQPVAPPEEARGLMDSILQDLGEIPDDYLVPAGDGGYRMGPHPEEQADTADVWKGTYHEKGAHLYNEWDFKRRHYRKNWCVLREIDVHPAGPEFVRKTLAKYLGLTKSIRRTFEALRGEEKTLKRQPNGENIDIDALVEAYGDARAGREMTSRVFAKLQKVERNIAVMFMVDMSGSTKGWINDAEREALTLLCEALETLGDRYAIYGFSGWTRKRCELYRIKRFDEPYNEEVKGRIAGIQPRDYTRMGVTIRHLTRLLEEVDARTRLLITLSDGKPDDFDGYRGEYGIEDTRMALIEAKRSGIHPFCITIDKEGHDYLPHMYGAVNYTFVDDVSKLPLRVSDIYRRLTT